MFIFNKKKASENTVLEAYKDVVLRCAKLEADVKRLEIIQEDLRNKVLRKLQTHYPEETTSSVESSVPFSPFTVR